MDALVNWKEFLRRNLLLFILAGIAVCAVGFYLMAFVIPNHPSKPGNVPKSATLVFGGFTHFWQECWFDAARQLDRCRIYNAGGVILRGDVFLPESGGAAISADQLQIVPGVNAESVVHLSNGSVLIPEKNFDAIKRGLHGDDSESK